MDSVAKMAYGAHKRLRNLALFLFQPSAPRSSNRDNDGCITSYRA